MFPPEGRTGRPSRLPVRHPRPQRGRWSDAQAYAALDLGTNNCRLLIARPQGGGFAVVDAFSRIVRLGEGWRRPAACPTPRSTAPLQPCGCVPTS
ncbi:hypothetical protein GCM10020258_15830 [Sphingomonas yabuuchiae]